MNRAKNGVYSWDTCFGATRMQTSDNDLESKLAGFVRSYIHASESQDAAQAEEALRWVCSALEHFLGSLLDECDGWRGWVDGITPATDMLPDAVKVGSKVDLTVRGQALRGEHRGPFWIEPFLASVQIAATHDELTGYEIHFGDAARGLATFPSDKNVRRLEWYSPTEWLFVFSKGTLTKKDIAEGRSFR
jgi:hypothetical protein